MTTLIKKIYSIFKSEETELELTTPQHTTARFELYYQELIIGVLSLKDGSWYFTYSSDFIAQSEISPLVDFPNINAEYRSETLFPFFAFRIPSLQRLKLQKLVAKEIPKDEVSLLKLFGRNSIANPFKLIPNN